MTCSGSSILSWTALVMVVIATLPRVTRRFRRPLNVGDRVRIRGGYEDPPEWLQGRGAITGRVVALIPESDGRSAAEVALDSPLSASQTSYTAALLRLRYKDARWTHRGVVHVELWAASPSEAGRDPAAAVPHEWVESHASYSVIV